MIYGELYLSSKRWQGLQHIKSVKHWRSSADYQQAFTATSKMLGTGADGEGNSGINQALVSPSLGSF
jgi:hypothetical protein